MVDVGALFTEGLYRPRLAPNRRDRHYLWVGRISGFAITMLGVLYAMFLIQSVLYTFLLTETLATFVGISVLGGIVWPRANRWGALASLLTALAANFLLYYLAGRAAGSLGSERLPRRAPCGIVALVAVSLLTGPEPAERPESFFEPAADVERRGGRRRSPAAAGQRAAAGAAPRRDADGRCFARISVGSRWDSEWSSRWSPPRRGCCRSCIDTQT